MKEQSCWITTHWPPLDGQGAHHAAIWVPDGREAAGAPLAKGDLVFVYESRTGRSELRVAPDGTEHAVHRGTGAEGIVALARVDRQLEADGGDDTTHYVDGTEIWWRWHAPMTPIRTDGFVSRDRLTQILGYSPKYSMRGFGDFHSGLKRISQSQFDLILSEFRIREGVAESSPAEAALARARGGTGRESEQHRLLKLYVAENPDMALGESGIIKQAVEFDFPTGDRADVYLQDRFGRVMGVEIEVEVDTSDLCGPLQALKYRSMLEFIAQRGQGEGRAVLVAYKISRKARERCESYGIECHTVSYAAVERWSIQTSP